MTARGTATILAGLVAGLATLAFADPSSDAAAPGASALAPAFRVLTVAPGVDLYAPDGRGPDHANSLVVELEDGLLVVDAQPTPAAARDLLAAIAARTDRRVRFLVFTHPHAVSSGGADAFPRDVVRFASRGYRDAVADSAYDYLGELRGIAAVPESIDHERPRAGVVLFGRTRIEDARRTAILLPVGDAHSPGDLIVFLPEDGVVAVGDLAFADRDPFAGSARISAWIAQLNQLASLHPRAVVPLRGPPVEPEDLNAQRAALEWLVRTVEELVEEGVADADIPVRIRQDPELGGRLASGPASHLPLLVERAIAEVRDRRRQQGLE